MPIEKQHTDSAARQRDEFWMKKALSLAHSARENDEVPVGALLVASDGISIISKGFNRRESWHTPLGHAELIAIHRASQKLGSWRLPGTTLYVTLEPCAMCAGAIVQSRISRVVFGASDPKGGAGGSLWNILNDPRTNHRCTIQSGVLHDQCSSLIKEYFKTKRTKK